MRRHAAAAAGRSAPRRSSRSATTCSTACLRRSRPRPTCRCRPSTSSGPATRIEVQLIGNTKGRYALVVGRDGRINFPELGPIAVSGRRFEEVRADLEERVREQMIGTQASIGIGELRSIRVFVLGDAQTPGSYTVSGLSTITNALFVSGGVKKIGSLRNIQLKRSGRTVTTLDLYDLLLQGRYQRRCAAAARRRDLRAAGRRDRRPRRRSAPAGDLRAQERNDRGAAAAARRRADAGGGSDGRDARARRRAARARDASTSTCASAAGQAQLLRSGDTLRVPAIRPVLEDSVVVSGYVHRPGRVPVQARHAHRRRASAASTSSSRTPISATCWCGASMPPDRRRAHLLGRSRARARRAELGGELRARAARPDLRLRPGVRPRPHHRAADARAAHAVAHRRADARK